MRDKKKNKKKKKQKNKNKNIVSERLKFIKNISLLPRDIQGKIYILCFRDFWRSYVPLTAQIPSWYNQKIVIEKEIFESKINNIHFLHLSFNTLEENKKYILGCQCNHCRVFDNVELSDYNKLIADPWHFNNIMPNSTEGINNFYTADGDHVVWVKNYDPYCGTIHEDLISYSLRTGEKLHFGFSGEIF